MTARSARPRLNAVGIAAAALLAACSRPAEAPKVVAAPASVAAASAPADDGIAWRHASSDADVDSAFDSARRDNRPVFVYWGAKWCPPCNQLKATLFNRHDFIERSRAFVPVYVDGDSPGAQRLGARFQVSGYPTMVLFSAQGTELTRLPGEVDAARYTEVMTLGMNAQKSAREVLAQALQGGAGLTPSDWRLLAFYSWDTDQQLVGPGGTPALLKTLAAACPPALGDVARRLQLQALATTAPTPGMPPMPAPASLDALRALLADAAASRAQTDVLVAAATDIVRAASAAGTPARAELLRAFDTALQRLQNDATLSRADRIAALSARVDLARMDAPSKTAAVDLPAGLLAEVRDLAARSDREITDGYERQAVVTAAADTLAQAGLGPEAKALLEANLAKSHSPYYLMSMLSKQAREAGDVPAAIDWSARAFEASEGPATRLQWGASYMSTLVALAPQDEARIENTADALFSEAAAAPDAFYGRSGRSLQRVGTALLEWNGRGRHAAVISRLQTRLSALCGGLPADGPTRAGCNDLLAKKAVATTRG